MVACFGVSMRCVVRAMPISPAPRVMPDTGSQLGHLLNQQKNNDTGSVGLWRVEWDSHHGPGRARLGVDTTKPPRPAQAGKERQ